MIAVSFITTAIETRLQTRSAPRGVRREFWIDRMEPRSARPAGFRVHRRGIRTHEASRTLMRLAVPAYLILPSGLRMTTLTSPLGALARGWT